MTLTKEQKKLTTSNLFADEWLWFPVKRNFRSPHHCCSPLRRSSLDLKEPLNKTCSVSSFSSHYGAKPVAGLVRLSAALLLLVLLVALKESALGMQNGPPVSFQGITILEEKQTPIRPVPGLVQVPSFRSSRARQLGQPAMRIVYPDELYGPRSLRPRSELAGDGFEQAGDNEAPEVDLSASYVIENKRFVEAVSTRCLSSTILEDPSALEPEFIFIKPQLETRLDATASKERIKGAGFDPRQRTTILVHGFTQSYPNTTWLRHVRALFEQHHHVDRSNLIIMDWGRASHGPFSQAAAVVSGMASFLASFIMKLTDLGADRMNMHVIGHSLGAHLAGFAGKRLFPRIGRITALDPAGPCFGKIFSNSPQDRLAPNDAIEVDVFHYDDDFLGLPGQHGQFDVYVNGGSSQPGCQNNVNAMFQAMITMIFRRNRVLSESHTRSTEVASVSLARSGCQGVAYECRDYPTFQAGECGKCDEQNNQCFLINFDFQYDQADRPPLRTSFPGKRLYISAEPNDAYCVQHYQILVKFEPHPEMRNAAKRDKWRCILEIPDESDKISTVQLTNQMAPNVFSALLLVEGRPSRFQAGRLQIKTHDGSLVNLQKSLHKEINDKSISHRVFTVEINFMSNINPNIRRALSSNLCPVVRPPQLASRWNSIGGDSANTIGDSQSDWLELEECLPRFG